MRMPKQCGRLRTLSEARCQEEVVVLKCRIAELQTRANREQEESEPPAMVSSNPSGEHCPLLRMGEGRPLAEHDSVDPTHLSAAALMDPGMTPYSHSSDDLGRHEAHHLSPCPHNAVSETGLGITTPRQPSETSDSQQRCGKDLRVLHWRDTSIFDVWLPSMERASL